MPLTSAQKTTLKNDITANVNAVPAGMSWTNGFQGQAINTLPNDNAGNATIAGWYNQTAAPDFYVWRDLPMETVLGLITYAAMTPADAVPTTPDLSVQVYIARALACQGKQFNLQNLTIGRTTAPMKRTNYRAAMQDCLTNIPAGANGAGIAANWTGVRDAAKSLARYVERILATGTGSQVSPADLGYEGTVSGDDVESARNS